MLRQRQLDSKNLLYTAEYAGGLREKVFGRAGPKAWADYQNVFAGRVA